MKIALITDGISPYVLGGMQRHSYYLVKYLAQTKVELDLFHFNESELEIEKLGVFSEEEKKYIKAILIPFPKTVKFPGHYIYRSYLYSKRVLKVLKPNLQGYDFIYTKGFTGWKLLSEKSRGLKMPPVSINAHGYEMFQPAPSFKSVFSLGMLRFFMWPLLKKSDKVFSYGGEITNLLTEKVKIPAEKIIEVPGGIENTWLNESIKPISGHTRFVFLGRAERRKGIEELNKVLHKIKGTQDFSFTFVGPIPEHLKINSAKISYLGEIRDTGRLKEVLFAQDVLVCPSHSEGMPNVILEAMANQLAVVATDVGAVSMLVDKKNGWLLPKPDISLLEQTMIQVCNMDRKELQRMQKNALQKVKENFLWERIIKTLIEKIA